MKLTVQHHDIRSTNVVDTLIEERILALQPRLQVEEASVRLEHRGECSPPYRIAVHLVVPGPDLLAEGRDHTLRAAIDKAMSSLERRISRRALQHKRQDRDTVRTRP